ncbi:uroporphyrinogen-III C-methyltransferase [Paenibacillus sp. N1-5-1-14]|uniref:uroporphyrinogen-III C-methyltransferase n=1 Tax=Paenibacillus radicibacter TaxID=2972488 RepID=UPI0021592025|nr:uroporphyrinogen-III C-methyltransferase [Paenibacillus radicibacter]MCR8644175.1 uroporphyrinogen-III C-methyltransferase [Paenibacillus radicibacter]
MNHGKVYLVGAGPGDPKLITIRGLEAIQKADVIVYDRLASPRLLKHRKTGSRLIFVGKLPDKHMMKQHEINQLLVDLAIEGHVVTRLKGGDPTVFGRVGEEAETLANNNIAFEIVPGVTSAIAVPAYAGIPVTYRDLTSSFAVVTGHEYPNKTYSRLEWEHLAKAVGTMVFLMGVANLEQICSRLIDNGKPLSTPVAIIRWGTWMEQRTLVGTLETIVDQVREANFQSPAVIIIGEVVSLREKLAWFEKKPLFGQRILVTRARSQASELAEAIDELGGEAIEFPVISIQAPTSPEVLATLDHALHNLAAYEWVFFTSSNGVDYFFRRLRELGLDIRALTGAKIAAVGPKTAEALSERGIVVDIYPEKFQAEDLLEAVRTHLKQGDKVLIPTNRLARGFLTEELSLLGIEVSKVEAYENIPCTEDSDEVVRLLEERAIGVVTFTSSSTVRNLFEALAASGVKEPIELLAGVRVACIGPKTAETAREFGLDVSILAEEATIQGLIDALITSRD